MKYFLFTLLLISSFPVAAQVQTFFLESDTADVVDILSLATEEETPIRDRGVFFRLRPGCPGIELETTADEEDPNQYRITSVEYTSEADVLEIRGFKSGNRSMSGFGIRSQIGREQDGVTLSAGPAKFRNRDPTIDREERRRRYNPTDRSSQGVALVINIRTR